MTRVGYDSTQWIAEDGRGLLERYFVLDEICRSLSRIPLELDGQPSLYLRGEDWVAARHGRDFDFQRDWPITELLPACRLAAAKAVWCCQRRAADSGPLGKRSLRKCEEIEKAASIRQAARNNVAAREFLGVFAPLRDSCFS